MFKFLFGKKDVEVAIETQRQTATRALEELNTVLAALDPKPSVKLDMNSGQIEVDWPDQMPDEALALPAPTEEKPEEIVEKPETVEEIAEAVEEAVAEKAA